MEHSLRSGLDESNLFSRPCDRLRLYRLRKLPRCRRNSLSTAISELAQALESTHLNQPSCATTAIAERLCPRKAGFILLATLTVAPMLGGRRVRIVTFSMPSPFLA